MPIFNDLYYAAPRSSYIKKPIEAFAQAGAMYQDQYDKGLQAYDAWNTFKSNLPARDALKGQLQDEINKYQEQWKPLVEQGNYEDAAPVLRKISQDFVANPIIKGITEDYNNYNAAIKDAQDRLAKGKITADRFQKEVARTNKRFSKPLEYDPLTSQYKNKFNNFFIPDNVDIEEEVTKRIDKIKSGNLPVGYDSKGNPQYVSQNSDGSYINTTTVTGVSEDQIAKIAYDYLNSNDEVNQLLTYDADLEAELRDGFQKSDLIDMGVMSKDGKTQIPDLINEDGSVNQNVAKQAYVLSEKQKVVDYAKGYAYSNLDIKSKADVQAEHAWQSRRDEINRNFAKADKVTQSEYIKIFNLPLGAETNLDNKAGEARYGTKADVQSMTFDILSSKTKEALGSASDIETAAIVSDIKDKINNIEKYRKEIKSNAASNASMTPDGYVYDDSNSYDFKKKPANLIGKEKSEITTLLTKLAQKDPKYAKYLKAKNESDFNNNLLSFKNEVVKTLDEPTLKELENASLVDKDLKGLVPIENSFKVSTKEGINNVVKTYAGIKVGSEFKVTEKDYDNLDKKTRKYLENNNLSTFTTDKKGKKVYTIYAKYQDYPNPTTGLLFDKKVGVQNDNRGYMDEAINNNKRFNSYQYTMSNIQTDLKDNNINPNKLESIVKIVDPLDNKVKEVTASQAFDYAAKLTADDNPAGASMYIDVLNKLKTK